MRTSGPGGDVSAVLVLIVEPSFRIVRPENQLVTGSRLILSETFSGGIDELPDASFLRRIGLGSISRSSSATLNSNGRLKGQ